MTHANCGASMPAQLAGIRPDGGIPEALGTAGACSTVSMLNNGQVAHSGQYLQGVFVHAELLHRRGDDSLFHHMGPGGVGQPLNGILFLLHQGETLGANSAGVLDIAFRRTMEPQFGAAIGTGSARTITNTTGEMLQFTTLTAGLPDNPDAGMPPPTPITAVPVD
jgi:hypothetical protein